MPLHVMLDAKWKGSIILMLIPARFSNEMSCGLGTWPIDVCKLIGNSDIVGILHGG